jgi:hypothetical protein
MGALVGTDRASGATGYLARGWPVFFRRGKEKEVEPEEMLNGASKGKPGALDTVPGSPGGPLAKGNDLA